MEGAPRHPSPEELERAQKAHQIADPTTFSSLPPETLTNLGTVQDLGEDARHMNQKYSGADEEWYALQSLEYPALQQLGARLLKGVVNVADVVELGGTMYSKRMPHDRITQEMSEAEVEADIELIGLILIDRDRNRTGELNPHSDNFRYESGRASYFDFGSAKMTERDIPFSFGNLSPAALKIVSQKLAVFKAHYDSPEGKKLAQAIYRQFLEANAREGDYVLHVPEEHFYDMLMTRILYAQHAINRRIEKEHLESSDRA